MSNNREIDSIELQDDKFVFTDILPGKYRIDITGLDSICLNEDKMSITVESSNLDVNFKQTGYRVKIYSPIDAKMVSNWFSDQCTEW